MALTKRPPPPGGQGPPGWRRVVGMTAALAVLTLPMASALALAPRLAATARAVASRSGATAATAASTPPRAEPGVTYHQVTAGDTLYDLAVEYGTDVATIKKLNGLSGDTIYPGQWLAVKRDSFQLYRVKAGDTLWDIARRYGTTVEWISAANGLKDPGRIAIGALLKLPVSGGGRGRPADAVKAASVTIAGIKLSWPLRGNITSPFGMRDGKMHTGIDLAANYGDSIKAAADGVVQSAGWISGYGQTIIIKHGGGVQTLYAHIQKILVKAGKQVKQGQVIATVGSTGHSTGPHLHFEVRKNSQKIDPLTVLAP